MIAAMPSFLVPEKIAFEDVTILVSILAETMTKALLELTLEEKLVVSKQLAETMETVIFPLSFVPEVPVELISAHSWPLSAIKTAIILISISVDGFAFAMR